MRHVYQCEFAHADKSRCAHIFCKAPTTSIANYLRANTEKEKCLGKISDSLLHICNFFAGTFS